MQSERIEQQPRYDLLICTGLAIGLAYLFWAPLWHGGGLIGGDIYSYFLPQKQYLAEHLQLNEFPLWNNRSGHGYPLVAESQTAAFYPPNLLAYRFLNVNTAYNAIQIAHYVLAFMGVWLYARKLGLSFFARALAATIFTYGWFPPRMSLEWAIVTGAWMPWLLFFTERFATSRKIKDAAWITLGLSVQLLAGHYNLAFATILITFLYGTARLTFWKRPQDALDKNGAARSLWQCGVLLVALLCAFGLASFKLWPSYELMRISQRSGDQSNIVDTAYGHIPVVYLTQVVAPWVWYGQGVDLNRMTGEEVASTNVVEAHLYFGLIPIAIIVVATFRARLLSNQMCLIWAAFGALFLLVATGLLSPLTDSLPGFGYFRGAGRYGIVTTVSAAIIAGIAFDRLFVRPTRMRSVCGLIVVAGTVGDLWLVSGLVGDSTVLETPVINYVDESPVKQHLADYPDVVRLYSPGPNLPNSLGVASTPPYLGLGPSEYFNESLYPAIDLGDRHPTPEVVDWMQRAGVTHILNFHQLDESVWPIELAWSGLDPFLNRAWARMHPPEPFFLYELRGSRGRIAWWDEEDVQRSNGDLRITQHNPDVVVAECHAIESGRVVLTDLAYPGWNVYVDGELVETIVAAGLYRSVYVSAGRHQIVWRFEPSWGLAESMSLSFAVLAVLGCLRWLRSRPTSA